MKALARVRETIAGGAVDHLAAQPMIMMYAAKHIGVHYIECTKNPRMFAEAQLRMAEDFGIDCLLTCSDPAREVIDIAGEGSVDWFTDQGPAINEERAALADAGRLGAFRVPDPWKPGRMRDRITTIEIMRKAVGEDLSVVGWVEGPLALGQELRGLNRIMLDLVDDPGFVDRLLDFTADVAIKYAAAQIAAGADTIGMSDAAASMIGPGYYERFVFPRQLRVLKSIKDKHPEVITRLHMCGQTGPLLGKMRELPADIFELDFPVDLPMARAALGPGRVISGNVSTITDLLEGTPEEVYGAAEACHRTAGKWHIVNSGCEVSPLTPEENLRALIAYAKEHKP